MRVSEVQNLKLQDLDLKERVLTIRGAKFGKDRLVPLHPSTCRVLARYIDGASNRGRSARIELLFVSSRGNRLDDGDIRRTFTLFPARLGCAAQRTATGLDYMTSHSSGSRIIPANDGGCGYFSGIARSGVS